MSFSPRSSGYGVRLAAAFGLAAALVAGPALAAPGTDQNTDKTFETFRKDAFGDKAIERDSALLTIDAPIRAEDAAVVPVDVNVALPKDDSRTVKAVTLIVDENPSPVAATFTLGQERREFALSTRLRVNAYSSVRAVLETSDGQLHMAARFVKASGGCSAPALKDEDQAMANLGQLKFRTVAENASAKPRDDGSSEAQLMIRHPNYSGLQMNPLDRSYIPARFVNKIVVKQGAATVFTMEGGISLSEDPAIQFSYLPGADPVTVNAQDTEGVQFSGEMQGRPKS
ncbi:quinoprotein dehydrogenase-associated SoxYZ-like carrier [Methylopila henanensis]|uniref:Quinoprotein dehydrogenase-associated SoxYZ-like carrier n=1 Tax=Methylopila henanensis TaxID=873516 RepID=A0ABW4K2W0_9HYPH